MNKPIIIRVVLCLLLAISGASDFLTFAWHKNMLALESNVLYNLTHSILFLGIFKFMLMAGIIFYLIKGIKMWKLAKIYQFGWVLLAVILIMGQFLGTYANVSTKEKVRQETGYDHIEDIPVEEVTKYALPEEQKTPVYLKLATTFILLPILLSLLSFQLWEWGYYEKEYITVEKV